MLNAKRHDAVTSAGSVVIALCGEIVDVGFKTAIVVVILKAMGVIP